MFKVIFFLVTLLFTSINSLKWPVTSCIAGDSSTCSGLEGENDHDGFACCASIKIEETGKQTSTIYECVSRFVVGS